MKKIEIEFLRESNKIEEVYDDFALEDAKKAWKYALTVDVMTPGEISKIHAILMKRIDPQIAGTFRTFDIRIGRNIVRYKGMDILLSTLQDICDKLNNDDLSADSLARAYAKETHVDYEHLHPFPDGNGRSGRILYNWHLTRMDCPIHVIHQGKEQWDYYGWF